MKIVLASSSKYRKTQLTNLGYSFESHNPNIDETRFDEENPQELVDRLAKEKARSVSVLYPESIVISGDQVATYQDHVLGEPLNRDRAIESLTMVSGQKVVFLSAACVKTPTYEYHHIEPTIASFRKLTSEEIGNYIDLDEPYDCAGSFRSEKLGLHLLENLNSNDPSALMGLPLIWLGIILRQIGINPLN